MAWILSAILCFLLVEICLRLPLDACIKRLLSTARQSGHILRSPHISDHWKEKASGAYSRILLMQTMRLTAMAGLAIGLSAGPVYLFGRAVGVDILPFISSWTGIIFTTCIAMLYIYLKNRLGHAVLFRR